VRDLLGTPTERPLLREGSLEGTQVGKDSAPWLFFEKWAVVCVVQQRAAGRLRNAEEGLVGPTMVSREAFGGQRGEDKAKAIQRRGALWAGAPMLLSCSPGAAGARSLCGSLKGAPPVLKEREGENSPCGHRGWLHRLYRGGAGPCSVYRRRRGM